MKQFEVKRKQIEYLSKAMEVVLFLLIERKLGLEGSGFFLVPVMIFYMLWTFLGEHLPDVLGKLIRSRRAKGQFRSIKDIRFYALLCQLVMGVIGAVLMLTLGTFLGEKVFACPYSSLMIWILAPLPFLRGISQLFLGYCQGEGFELPAVITCILRIVVIYVLGTIFGAVAMQQGEKISALLKMERYVAMYAGAGWCLAIVTTELAMVLFLFLSFLGTRKMKKNVESESMKASVSLEGYVGAASRNMIFKALIHFMEVFPVAIGMMIYYQREGEGAPLTYATFFVGYFAVCLVLYYLMTTIAIPYWGKVTGYIRKDEMRLARTCFHGGIHQLFAFSVMISAGISTMASQVGALTGFTSPNLVKVVIPGSFWILFASLAFYFSRMLMRLGKNLMVVLMALLSDVVFVMVFLIFWSDEKMGLMALTYAGLFAAGIYAVLLGAMAIQLIGGRVNWLKIMGIPLGAAALVTAVQVIAVRLLGEQLQALYVVLGVGGVGMFLYLCALLMLRNFSQEELSMMPLGGVLYSLGQMLSVF